VLFSAEAVPKRIVEIKEVQFYPAVTSGIVWKSVSVARIMVRRDGHLSWIDVDCSQGDPQSSDTALPAQIGEPRLWFLANGWTFVKGLTDQTARWWAERGGRLLPVTALVPGSKGEPLDLVPISNSPEGDIVACIFRESVDLIRMSDSAAVVNSIPLSSPVRGSVQHIIPAAFASGNAAPIDGDYLFLVGAPLGERFRANLRDLTVQRIDQAGQGLNVLSGVAHNGASMLVERYKGVQTILHRAPTGATVLEEANSFYKEIAYPMSKSISFTPDRLADGVKQKCCNAALYLPAGSSEPRPLPLVVSVYLDRVDSQKDSDAMMDFPTDPMLDPRLTTSHGYAFLAPDMPFQHGKKAGDSIDAVAAYVLPAIDAAVRSGWVDRNRIAFIGTSFGGLNVLQLLTRTDIAKAAISRVGLFNLVAEWGSFTPNRTLGNNAFPTDSPAATVEGGQTGMRGTPWEDTEQYLYNSPDTHVANIRTPTLLLKGDQDVVSQHAAEYAFLALKRVGVPVRLVLFHGEAHGVRSGANQARYAKEVLDWLDTYLGERGVIDPVTIVGGGPRTNKR
jgi:pimeloyl-ACP methyl ester carboxylesterase